MNAQDVLAHKVRPDEIALMVALADDLAAGGVELFQRHEREWRNTNLAQFMFGAPPAPKRRPPVLDLDAIYAKFNRLSR